MTAPRDTTNTTERAPRPSRTTPDEPRRASGPEGQSSTMPPRRSWLWFALLLIANFLLVRFLFPGPEAPVEVPYTFFKAEVRPGKVKAINTRGDTIGAPFEEPVPFPRKERKARRLDRPNPAP